jgi:hypothetical protein
MSFSDFLAKLFLPRPAWGVWIPGTGWLRNASGQPYADTHKKIARSVAKRLPNARVEYIDTALADKTIEQKFLSSEKYGNL